MKQVFQRLIAISMSAVMLLGLSVPVYASNVSDENQKSLQIVADANDYVVDVKITASGSDTLEMGKEPLVLTAEVTKKSGQKSTKGVIWKSSDTSVATVSSNGVVTAVGAGIASITASSKENGHDGSAVVNVFKVTVVDNRLVMKTDTINIQKGSSAVLSYMLNDSTVTGTPVWSSENQQVATVSKDGVVRAVGEGKTHITVKIGALSATGEVTVTDCANDGMTLSFQQKNVFTGEGVSIGLESPVCKIENEGIDVTENYAITYAWTDSTYMSKGTERTIEVTHKTQGEYGYICNIVAVNKEDDTCIFTDQCNYKVKVLPKVEVKVSIGVENGTVPLKTLKVTEEILKQIENLNYVEFLIENANGTDNGTLKANSSVSYYISEAVDGNKLSDVGFEPQKAGDFTIPFLGYGNSMVYGVLSITIEEGKMDIGTDTPSQELPSQPEYQGDGDYQKNCTSKGVSFSGSDFFSINDADPVVSIVFEKPSSGKLVRNIVGGSGIIDTGTCYYTDSSENGEYHVSTLSYIPKAGFEGKAVIPMNLTHKSGTVDKKVLVIKVSKKQVSDKFIDINADTVGIWAADAVDYAYTYGLVNGTGEGQFSPYMNMNRAMLVTILYRSAGSPDVAVTTNFVDLNDDAYYYNAVLWAAAMGVVNGTSDTTFSPNDPVTREQIAAILYRYSTAMGEGDGFTNTLKGYSDIDAVSAYAYEAMTWAVDRGIITGTTETTLSPLDQATRAQVAVMMHRYLTY